VPGGLVFGYLGPNGAGKTTTIRLLAGLLRPTSGQAEIGGHDVGRQREQAQRMIGYLPGDFVGHPDLTAAEYLDYLGSLRGGVDTARVRALADRLGLDLSLRIGAMSHGTRQKAGIVQAFQHRPEVLILDEPTAGLDPLVQREFLAMVRDARRDGQTVFSGGPIGAGFQLDHLAMPLTGAVVLALALPLFARRDIAVVH
jgi:ABC-2 type transport system ATP-binding protein